MTFVAITESASHGYDKPMNPNLAAAMERGSFAASELIFGSSKLFAINLYLALLRRLPDLDGFRHYEIASRNPDARLALVRHITDSEEAKRLGVSVSHDVDVMPSYTEAESLTRAMSLFWDVFIPVLLRLLQHSNLGDDSRQAAFQLIADVNVEQMHLLEAEVGELRGRINRTQTLVDFSLQQKYSRGGPLLPSPVTSSSSSPSLGELEETLRRLSDGFDSLHSFVTKDLQHNLITFIVSLISITHEKIDLLFDSLNNQTLTPSSGTKVPGVKCDIIR